MLINFICLTIGAVIGFAVCAIISSGHGNDN